MSQIQRVIILNKPFKIRGYTIMQWLSLGAGLALALLVGTKIPHDMKLGNLPLGFVIGMLIFSTGIVLVHLCQVKPLAWWRNRLVYSLGIAPTVYLPKREEGQEYPDSSIKQAPKREDQPYVDVETFADDYR